MTGNQRLHFFLAMTINLIIVGLQINEAWKGNDKAILLVIVVHPLLVILNAIVWGTLSVLRKAESKIYRMTTLVLLMLFVPAVLMATMY